jgi:hypothetical protein
LALLVAWVFANHPDSATPTDDLTFVADLLDAGSNLHGIPQSELGDDLPAILVVTGGTNLNAISNDEPAVSVPCCGVECCCDPPPIRKSYCVEQIREHFFYRSGRIGLTRRESTSNNNCSMTTN